jgi:single-strand DNA-binding protein
MSGDINRVVIVGRLTRDAELSYTNTGFALTKFSVALNRRKKEGENWVDEANFFDCQIWGKRGEALNQYLIRGQQVAIEGELRQERWEKDGVKRSKVSIEATNIQLLGGKSDGQQGDGQYGGQQGQGNPPPGNQQFQTGGNQAGGAPPGAPAF